MVADCMDGSRYERLTIADSLVAETFPANHEIIRQYEAGDKFYIIEQVRRATAARGCSRRGAALT